VPIYEYQCDACGHRLETLQKISDAPLKTCPECHQDSLRKRISAAAFVLKGSGWYETDFKNKQPPKPAADKTKATDSKTDAGSADKSKGESKGADSKTADSGKNKPKAEAG